MYKGGVLHMPDKPLYTCPREALIMQGRPLSDVKPHECRWKLLPPRKVHPAVLQSLKQVQALFINCDANT